MNAIKVYMNKNADTQNKLNLKPHSMCIQHYDLIYLSHSVTQHQTLNSSPVLLTKHFSWTWEGFQSSTLCVLTLRCNTMHIQWHFHYCLGMWCHTAGRFAYSFWLELSSSALKMEAADLSETLAPNYHTMWCHKLENFQNSEHHIAHLSGCLLICYSLPWKTNENLLFTNGSNKWHWNTCFSWYDCVTYKIGDGF